MAHELTTEEVRERFLDHVRTMVHYWETVSMKQRELVNETELHARLSGVAFSILVLLDGGTRLPGFIVAPVPHESDKAFHQNEGSDWYPENHRIEGQVQADIAGCLHELFYPRKET